MALQRYPALMPSSAVCAMPVAADASNVRATAQQIAAQARQRKVQDVGHVFLSGGSWDRDSLALFAQEVMALLPQVQRLACVHSHEVEGFSRLYSGGIADLCGKPGEPEGAPGARAAFFSHKALGAAPAADAAGAMLLVYGQGDCKEGMERLLRDHSNACKAARRVQMKDSGSYEDDIARLPAEAIADAFQTSVHDVKATAGVVKDGAGVVVAERCMKNGAVECSHVEDDAVGIVVPFARKSGTVPLSRHSRIWQASNHVGVRNSHFRVLDAGNSEKGLEVSVLATNEKGAALPNQFPGTLQDHLSQVLTRLEQAEKFASRGVGFAVGILHPFNGSLLDVLKVKQVNSDGTVEFEGDVSRLQRGALCDIRIVGGKAAIMSSHRIHSSVGRNCANEAVFGTRSGACIVMETVGSRMWYNLKGTLPRTGFATGVSAVFDETYLATDGLNWRGCSTSSVGFTCPS